MNSKILPRRELEFLLYEWLNVETLTQRARYADHSRETFNAALDTCEKIATELFAPHNKKADQNEPHFDGKKVHMIADVAVALQAFSDAGLMAAGQDFEVGGMQLPCVLEKAGFAYFKGANVGTSSYPFLTIGNANLLRAHGTPAQQNRFVTPMMSGRYFGTMCLSEPQAGSSLGDIKTRAMYECDTPLGKRYRLHGNKMWISAGEHELSENIVHLVLAKVPDENGKLIEGVKGISLFIVPKKCVNETAEGETITGTRNDVVLAGLNHKMGYRGTTNCLLNFGEGQFKPDGKIGAIGYLVGEVGQGLHGMFHMMNEARIGVGLGAVMLGMTGYLHSLDYARTRTQGRKISEKNASTAPTAIINHADIKRMLLAQKAYVEGGLALALYCARLVDEERTAELDPSVLHNANDAEKPRARADSTLLLDILTPIAKSWSSQWCLEANSLAIQIHGGYGYTRDYNVEQFYRDNRLNPIHEGTHGIQGLDLLGRKVVMHNGAAFQLLQQRMQLTIGAAQAITHTRLQNYAQALARALAHLSETTQTVWRANHVELTLANASLYLEAFGHVVLAWIWLELALIAHDKHDDFYAGKRAACHYFYHYELPKIFPQLELLNSLDDTTLTMQDAWF